MAGNLVGGNAEMVRPEPHQPLDKADIGAAVAASKRALASFWMNLLRQRRRARHGRRVAIRGIGELRRHSPTSLLLIARSRPPSWRAARAFAAPAARPEVGDRARGFARSTADRRRAAGAGTIEIGKQRAARVAGDGRDRIAGRPEAESVQRQSCRFFTASGHDNSSRDAATSRAGSIGVFIVAKVAYAEAAELPLKSLRFVHDADRHRHARETDLAAQHAAP